MRTRPDPSEYSNVEYILLDPPCSGSGMTNRLNIFDTAANENRLQSLAYLQGKMLAFAMQNFPNAKKIVYSTCSVDVEENEQVRPRPHKISKSVSMRRAFLD